jgi:predicted nucleic acid-binding protein
MVTVCAIVTAELYEGAYRSNRLQQNLTLTQVQQFITQVPCLPFDSPTAEIAGQIAANLGLKGQSIGAYDTQIAAIAIANKLTLVTHNTNVPPNVQETLAGHAARAAVNRTYTRDHPHYPAVRVPSWSSWSSWLVEFLPFGSQIGITCASLGA